jgi:peptidoglycan/xylan/chitin deacetylase (PgdA/CDA1 family)
MTRRPTHDSSIRLSRLATLFWLLAAVLLLAGCAHRPVPVPQPTSSLETAEETATLDSVDPTADGPAEATQDPAGQVAVEPTAGLTSEATSTAWPANAPSLRARWNGILLKQVTTHEKLVALTFDDGPHKGMMIRATDMLDRAGAKATFFCVGGRVLLNQKETSYAFAHGMEIENHTWSHRELTRSKHDDLVQILAADSIIGEITGNRPLWVRPKSGIADTTGVAAIFGSGHLFAGWSVHAGDTGVWNARQIERHVLDHVRPGAVVDLHVTNPRTLQALPRILKSLNARGYKMVTISELALASK